MSKLKRALIGIAGGATAATALMLSRLDVVREPSWLEKMNEFEHFVLHLAFVMAGLITGVSGLGALLWSVLRFQDPQRRQELMTQALNAGSAGRLRLRHLGVLAVAALAAATVVLAKRHLIEPLWLEDLTPFEHFFLHLGFVAIGAIIGVTGLAAFVWSILRRLCSGA